MEVGMEDDADRQQQLEMEEESSEDDVPSEPRLTPSPPPGSVGKLPGRVRSGCQFRTRGTEYLSESGIKWMSSRAKRQCDRTLLPGAVNLTPQGSRLHRPAPEIWLGKANRVPLKPQFARMGMEKNKQVAATRRYPYVDGMLPPVQVAMKVNVIRDVDNVSQSFFSALNLVVAWTDPDYRESAKDNWVPTVTFTNAVSLQVRGPLAPHTRWF